MNIYHLIFILLVSATLNVLANDDSYESRWEKLSIAYEKQFAIPQGEIYERSTLNTLNGFWAGVNAKCSIRPPAIASSFEAIAIISKSGVITEFLPMPNDPKFSCYTKEMVGRTYPAPPTDSYLVRFIVQ